MINFHSAVADQGFAGQVVEPQGAIIYYLAKNDMKIIEIGLGGESVFFCFNKLLIFRSKNKN